MFWDESKIRHQHSPTHLPLELAGNSHPKYLGKKTVMFDQKNHWHFLNYVRGKKTKLVASFVHVNFTLKRKISPFDLYLETYSPDPSNRLGEPRWISEASTIISIQLVDFFVYPKYQ